MNNDEKSVARKVLGKGLNALIPLSQDTGRQAASTEGRRWVELRHIEDLEPGRCQPRKYFDDTALAELTKSIGQKGIIEPLIVRKKEKGYEIIVGERRWRAAQAAGLKEVPVIVKDVSDNEALEIALIENIQRQDLNPIEEASGYEQLIREYGLTQEQVAEKVGKDRSTVSNMIRLLSLPEMIRDMLFSGELSTGHARAILGVEDDAEKMKIARETSEKKLSVRQIEDLIRRSRATAKTVKLRPQATQMKAISEDLQRRFRTKVSITDRGKRGSIVLEYYSFEELDRLVQMLLGR